MYQKMKAYLKADKDYMFTEKQLYDMAFYATKSGERLSATVFGPDVFEITMMVKTNLAILALATEENLTIDQWREKHIKRR